MKLRVGTDCSGIEAPIQALTNLKINFKHYFSSDIDKYCRESIKANYEPEILYEDMTKRENKDLPNIDLYVCGFPCQPFSTFSLAEKRLGSQDKRGNIMLECIDVIIKKLPKIFILENVKGFITSEKGKNYEYLINTLKDIKKYDIYNKVLNTKDYGLPQNRERLYIIGIIKDIKKKDFQFPQKIEMKDIKECITSEKQKLGPFYVKLIEKLKHKVKTEEGKLNFIHQCYGGKIMTSNYSPCLTTSHSYVIYEWNKIITPREALNLQGFSKDFKQVVNNRQLFKQAGNSMSVSVLEELFKEIFKSVYKSKI